MGDYTVITTRTDQFVSSSGNQSLRDLDRTIFASTGQPLLTSITLKEVSDILMKGHSGQDRMRKEFPSKQEHAADLKGGLVPCSLFRGQFALQALPPQRQRLFWEEVGPSLLQAE